MFTFTGKDQMVDSTVSDKIYEKSSISDSCKILSAMLTDKKAHAFVPSFVEVSNVNFQAQQPSFGQNVQ